MYINVATLAISVLRFSSHCVVKFTIIYSTNYKTVWKSTVWEFTQYVVYYHTHSKSIDKCGENPQSARRKPNYHTKCGNNCYKFLSVYCSYIKTRMIEDIIEKKHRDKKKIIKTLYMCGSWAGCLARIFWCSSTSMR